MIHNNTHVHEYSPAAPYLHLSPHSPPLSPQFSHPVIPPPPAPPSPTIHPPPLPSLHPVIPLPPAPPSTTIHPPPLPPVHPVQPPIPTISVLPPPQCHFSTTTIIPTKPPPSSPFSLQYHNHAPTIPPHPPTLPQRRTKKSKGTEKTGSKSGEGEGKEKSYWEAGDGQGKRMTGTGEVL